MNFDSQTLAFALVIICSLQAIMLWAQSQLVQSQSSLRWWSWSSLCLAISFSSDLFTADQSSQLLVISSGGLVLSSALLYLGSDSLIFLQQPFKQRSQKLITCSVLLLSLGFVSTYHPHPTIIQAIVAGAIATFSGLTARIFHQYQTRSTSTAARALEVIFAVTAILFIGLTFILTLGQFSDRWINESLTQTIIDLNLLVASSFWTFGLILLTNQQAIAASTDAKVTLEQIFNASPDAILITRLSDGKIVRFNDKFLSLIGFERTELLNRSILDLDFWQDQSDREKMVDCLLHQGCCEDLEVTLKRPNQDQFIGLVSANLIQLGGIFHIISITQDITQRRQIEESLRQSEERFDLAVQGSTAAIWDWNIVTGALYFSPRYLEMLGYSATDLPPHAESFFNLLHPTDRIAVQVALESHFSPAQYPYDVEFRLRTASGEYRWFQATGIAVRDSDGQPCRMVGATLDITDRKQAEAALRESEQNYRTLLNSGQALIWIADADGLCYYFNSVWLDFTGRSLEQEAGEGWLQGVHPEDREYCLNTYRSAFHQQQSFTMEYRLHRQDEDYRWILNESSPRYDSAGNFLGYIGHCIDIHDRKQVEAALQREQEFTRILLDNMTDGVVACDAQGRLVLFNQLARDWHGLNALTIAPEDWSEHYNLYRVDGSSPLPLDEIPLVRALRQEQVREAEIMIQAKHAEPRYLLVSGGPFFDRDQQLLGAVIAMHDVTAQRKVEAQLNLSIAEAERFQAALDQVNSYVYMKDLQSCYTYANRATLDLFGCSKEALIGSDDLAFFPLEIAEKLRAIDARVFQGEQTAEEIQAIDPLSSQARFYWEVKTPIYAASDSTQIVGLLGISTDITERKQLEEKLQEQATKDGLTGINNRRHFLELAQAELKRACRLQHPLTIALIDVDHFKTINDTYGHMVGDQVLLLWTQFCQNNIREVDIFARLGGDEFVVLFPETTEHQAYQVMDRIRQSLAIHPIHLNSQEVNVTISVGIATRTIDIFSLDQLLEQADRALYQSKQAGRNQVTYL